ncbi:MAG TPA: nucleotide sugar dehydrogenase [Paracoccaceae bacterium]|nr:nucleotide sugar dehydrogenase [Paracoccaceae bacterium]
MRVSILGAGYVGAVSAACLSDLGNEITIADVNADKVERLGRGESPIIEKGLDELLKSGVERGLLSATTDVYQATMATEASLVCVGTPSRADGSLDLQYIEAVCETIGHALRDKSERHTVIMRSTMVPGTMDKVVIPALEAASGKKVFTDFGLAIYPEFLREGTAIRDFHDAAITLYGVREDESANVLRRINSGLQCREIVTTLEAAEAVKYANNAWHATKIVFANEIGNICRAAGIDGVEVMDIVCKDDRLNISPAYLRPGFAFGGSCLPKDLRALRSIAGELEVPTPMFDAALLSNELQIKKACDLIGASGSKKVGQFGLTFKDGTDDLRESPLIALGNLLETGDFDVMFYDKNVRIALEKREFRQHFEASFPGIAARFCSDPKEVYDFAETVVVGRHDKDLQELFARSLQEKKVVDLVRVDSSLRSSENYAGICW